MKQEFSCLSEYTRLYFWSLYDNTHVPELWHFKDKSKKVTCINNVMPTPPYPLSQAC